MALSNKLSIELNDEVVSKIKSAIEQLKNLPELINLSPQERMELPKWEIKQFRL